MCSPLRTRTRATTNTKRRMAAALIRGSFQELDDDDAGVVDLGVAVVDLGVVVVV